MDLPLALAPWLLLPALLWARRREGAAWGVARWALRAGLLLLLGLAALDPALPGPGAPRARAVVLDVSASLSRGKAQRRAWVLDALADLDPARDRASLVLAGAAPLSALPPLAPGELEGRLEAALLAPPPGHGSDLGAALREAARVGPGGEVLLISDGRDTGGLLLLAAREAGAAGIPVHVLAPDLPPPLGARLARLEAPLEAAPRERVRLTAEARAWRRTALELRLVLQPEGGAPLELARVRREVDPQDPLLLAVETPPLRPGIARVTAQVRVEGADDDPEDDLRRAAIRVGGRPRAVLVGAAPELGGVSAERVEPAGLAAALAAGAPPELVVLGDVPAAAVEGAVPALSRALAAGSGLAVLGAERAFGPGGYAGSALEALLPVQTGPGEERERPLTLLLALDGSGSMATTAGGGPSRWARALEAGLPLGLLRPGDALGVVVFAGAAELAVPPAPPEPGLRERLLAREPRGETDLGAGLLRALEAARGREGDLLVVLVSDAEDPRPERHLAAISAAAGALPPERLSVLMIRIAPPGAAPAPAYAALVAAVGPAAQLAEVAEAGDALRARIEGALLARRAALRSGAFPLTPTPEGAARGLVASGHAPVYAPVRAREGALALVRAGDPELHDPPVAVLGRREAGAVLAVSLQPGMAAPILGALLPALLPARAIAATLTAERAGGELELVARGPALSPGLPSGLTVRLEGPGVSATPVELLVQAPDRASARLVPAPAAATWATLLDPRGAPLCAVALPGALDDELAAAGPDRDALERVARASGGQVLATPPARDHPLPRPSGAAPPAGAGALLAGAALALLLLEAALGRTPGRRGLS